MSHRIARSLAATALALLATVAIATPAAAVTVPEKLSVLSGWTQTSPGSYDSWDAARNNQAAWAMYTFDWSTDYCSSSPDNPLGFRFALPCHRHDFGYRNYKTLDQFPANKDRLDDAFHADLKRVCGTYNMVVRPACLSLAWTYYQAVRVFGTVVISKAELDRVARMKADAEARAARER